MLKIYLSLQLIKAPHRLVFVFFGCTFIREDLQVREPCVTGKYHQLTTISHVEAILLVEEENPQIGVPFQPREKIPFNVVVVERARLSVVDSPLRTEDVDQWRHRADTDIVMVF